MAFFIYGTAERAVMVEEVLVKCPACETDQWADVLLFSVYFHIFWLPVFPVDKKATLICNHCGLQRKGLEPNEKLIPGYSLIKNKFRHPWYTWSVVLLIIGIVTIFIVTVLLDKK